MKYDFVLTSEQQNLVEQNIGLVERIVSRYIRANEGVCGLSRDDLRQEGALALCHAAAAYDGVSAQFSTYATTLIRNHLLDCCKSANTQQKHLCSLPVGPGFAGDEHPPPIPEPTAADEVERLIDQLDMVRPAACATAVDSTPLAAPVTDVGKPVKICGPSTCSAAANLCRSRFPSRPPA